MATNDPGDNIAFVVYGPITVTSDKIPKREHWAVKVNGE